MKLTSADEQIAAYCFKMPFIFHLIEEVSCNFGYALRLINIDHKAALNITQRTAANILLDGKDATCRRPGLHAAHRPPGSYTEYSVR